MTELTKLQKLAARLLQQPSIENNEVLPSKDKEGFGVHHALWMLIGIEGGYVTGNKAQRWLGYAQALLVTNKILTLADVRLLTKTYLEGDK